MNLEVGVDLLGPIFVAGHRGMVGKALVRKLSASCDAHLLTASREECNLLDQVAVHRWVAEHRPASILIAAAKVGGIQANRSYPADFLYENLVIATNLIHAAYECGVGRVLFLGSSCIYPRSAPQPMPESCLLEAPLEKTNEAYAVAKIAGLKLCEYFRNQHGVVYHSAMPTNLYGPGDNFHPENSHVIPGLIRRFHEAKTSGAESLSIWGTGNPRREFLRVDDLAEACLFLLQQENPPDLVTIGSGEDIRIRDLANLVAEVVGFAGKILPDPSKPDGSPRKLMDTSLINRLGWKPAIGLREGLDSAYSAFLSQLEDGSLRA